MEIQKGIEAKINQLSAACRKLVDKVLTNSHSQNSGGDAHNNIDQMINIIVSCILEDTEPTVERTKLVDVTITAAGQEE